MVLWESLFSYEAYNYYIQRAGLSKVKIEILALCLLDGYSFHHWNEIMTIPQDIFCLLLLVFE
jgi:hypothetical protein